ncbi:MAG: hypothetical protein PHW02_00985 [bacterium]|nr:hypothetical protein [bacterium]
MKKNKIRFKAFYSLLAEVILYDIYIILKQLFIKDESDADKIVKFSFENLADSVRKPLIMLFTMDINVNSVMITKDNVRISYVNYKNETFLRQRYEYFVNKVVI